MNISIQPTFNCQHRGRPSSHPQNPLAGRSLSSLRAGQPRWSRSCIVQEGALAGVVVGTLQCVYFFLFGPVLSSFGRSTCCTPFSDSVSKTCQSPPTSFGPLGFSLNQPPKPPTLFTWNLTGRGFWFGPFSFSGDPRTSEAPC